MRKTITLIIAILLITSLTACSDDTQATSTAGQATDGSTGGGQGQSGMNNNQTVGLVTEAIGNEVTIEIGEMQGGAMGGGGMPADGSMPEGTEPSEGGEMPERDAGEMPENAQRGEEGEMPERDAGEMPENAQRGEDGEMPERESGEMSGNAQRPSGEGTAAPGAGMVGEDTDYSELITLTGETQTYNIPVGTTVTQFGTEMTFSQITEDMYISIALNEEGNVTSVNILG